MKKLGIYVHIPFCERKCYYCDFISFSGRDEKIDSYMNSLLREVDLYAGNKDYEVDSIFIGGGSPSYIDEKYVEGLMDRLTSSFKIADNLESSLEANPGNLTGKKLEAYRRAGINRLSLGLQTLDNNILKTIGRVHTREDFFNNYQLARDLGFNNISIDMMFDLPDQNKEILLRDLEELVDLEPEHISLYSLIFEEGTRLTEDYKQGKLNLVDEEEERAMYHKSIEYLEKNGYEQYEISNFARRKIYSRHNIKYWEIEDYLGLGLGAHSLYQGRRFYNVDNLDEYFTCLREGRKPIASSQELGVEEERLEYIIMKLRMLEGINKSYFEERFGDSIYNIYGPAIEKNIERGLLLDQGSYIRFTKRGLDISNQVYLDFMP